MYVFGVLGPTLAFDLVRLLLVDMIEPDVELLAVAMAELEKGIASG